jgi:hypothetical protein
MDRDIAFFLTTDGTCLIDETVLATEMYRVNCPYSHCFGLIAEITLVSTVQGVRAILKVLPYSTYLTWFCVSVTTGLNASSDP